MSLASPLLPAVGMVVLTATVWVRLVVVRVREMRSRRIAPQAVSTSREAGLVLQQLKESDNFKNLFEVPVLFYALCLIIAEARMSSGALLVGCWMYVSLRAVHSAISCTYNDVMHRFSAYAASTILLFALWADVGVTLIRRG